MNKAIPFDITSNTGTTYDSTRTSLLGRASSKTLSSKTVVGSPLQSFTDTTVPVTFTPIHGYADPITGRVITTGAVAAGVLPIILHTFNFTTCQFTARVGRINLAMNAGTITVRSISGILSGTTGWRIAVSLLNATTANLSGLYVATSIALADFSEAPPTIPIATTGDTHLSKKVFHFIETGGTNLLTVPQCHAMSESTKHAYLGNNAAATFQVYKFDVNANISTVSASGQTTDGFLFKTPTGVLSIPATILLLNSFNVVTPASGPNAGQECLFIGGNATQVRGRTADITGAMASWPSIELVNSLDMVNTNTTITPLTAHYSETLDRIVFQAGAATVVKEWIDSKYEILFGRPSNTQYKTLNPSILQEWGAITVAGSHTAGGVLFFNLSTAGQVGIQAIDLRSDKSYNYSRIISKVIELGNSDLVSLVIQKAIQSGMWVRYRTDDFSTENSGTWINAPEDGDFSSIALPASKQMQIDIQSYLRRDGSTIPVQILSAHMIVTPKFQIHEKWAGNNDHTTPVGVTPSRTAFEVIETGITFPMRLTAYKKDGTVYLMRQTDTHSAEFEYTINDGSTWNTLGTPPDSLNTIVRYNWSSPPPDGLIMAWSKV